MSTTEISTSTASSPNLEKALRAFAGVVGEEHVLTSAADVAEFSDPYNPPTWADTAPQAVVQPASTEEVQAIVRLAVEHDVRLWVNSQGRNNGYGGSSARTEDAVVLNLRRMNRVLEVNEEVGYVVVEPGVSYNELYAHLRKVGSKFWMDCPDIGWGSVIGNACDHGTGFTRYGDHAGAIHGMEVVLPDGDVLRTGMGAMSNSTSWHVSKRGFGPSVDGLFLQSNFGIVTRAGFWLMPQPEVYMPCIASVASEEHVGELIEALKPFVISGEVPGRPMLFNPMAVAAVVLKRDMLYTGDGPVPKEILDGFSQQGNIGEWNVRLAIYGSEVHVADVYGRLEKALEKVPNAWITGTAYPGDNLPVEEFDQSKKVMAGIPDMSMAHYADFFNRPGGHVIFAATTPLTGKATTEIVDLVAAGAREHNVDLMAGAVFADRALIMVIISIYPLDDEDAARRSHEYAKTMIPRASKLGYGEYRGHTSMMDLIADQFDYNDHAMRRFQERLKDAIDPDGILSPGKQGIWARRDREARALDA